MGASLLMIDRAGEVWFDSIGPFLVLRSQDINSVIDDEFVPSVRHIVLLLTDVDDHCVEYFLEDQSCPWGSPGSGITPLVCLVAKTA